MAKERLRQLRWGWRERARSAWHVNPLDLVFDLVEGLSAEHEWVDVLQVASKARCRGLTGSLKNLEMWEGLGVFRFNPDRGKVRFEEHI